jgi:serpin B
MQTLASRPAAALAAGHTVDSCPSDYQLQIVNSVWGKKTYAWESSFLDVLAQSYGTGIYLADFEGQPDPARLAINGWVSCETGGKIQDLLPPSSIDMCTLMVLVDAIHLKLPWQSPFSTMGTFPGPFTTGAGPKVMPSFMNQTASYPYVDDGQAQIVALPLMGGQLSVVIAMPHGDLGAYEASLSPSSAALSVPTTFANVGLSLPKFTFTSTTFSIRKELEAMGMLQAFGDENVYMDGLGSPDFTGLVNPQPPPQGGCNPLQIDDVLQKATIGVQESGVEAAAATAVILASASSSGAPVTVPLAVNRPFLFSIVDATGAVLFVGHVQDPTGPGGP